MPPSPIDRNTPRSTSARSHDNPGYKPKTTAHQALAEMHARQRFEPWAWEKFGANLLGKAAWRSLTAMDSPAGQAVTAAIQGIATDIPSAVVAGLHILSNPNAPVLSIMFPETSGVASTPVMQRLANMGLKFATDSQWAISRLGARFATRVDPAAALSHFHQVIVVPETEFKAVVDIQGITADIQRRQVRARAISTFVENFSLQTDNHPSGQQLEIANAIIATAVSSTDSQPEQLAALAALPKLGRPGWDAMTKVVGQALKTPTDTDTFAAQFTALKEFSEIKGLAGSRRWQVVELMLAYKLTAPDSPPSAPREWRNAMALASVMGPRGAKLIANAKPLAGDEESFRMEQMRVLMSFGDVAATEIWNLMKSAEGARNRVLHLGDETLLVELLNVSRDDHRDPSGNPLARIDIAKRLQYRLDSNFDSNPELSVGIAHAMANFVDDRNNFVKQTAQNCVRAFRREPVWEEKLADGFIQNMMSGDPASVAHGQAGLRTIGATSLHYLMQARWMTYIDDHRHFLLDDLITEMRSDPAVMRHISTNNFTHAVGRPADAKGLEGTDSLEEHARNGLRPWEMVRELAMRGAPGAMALARLANTTTGDVLDMVREAERITAGRAVRSWPSEVDGQWRDGPAKFLQEVLTQLMLEKMLAERAKTPEAVPAEAEVTDSPAEDAEIAAAELQLTLSQYLPRIETLTVHLSGSNPIAIVAALHALYNSAMDLHTVDGQSVQNNGPSYLRPVMDQLFKLVKESEFVSVRAAALRTAAYLDRDATMPRINEILSGGVSPAELRLAAISALGDRRLELTDEATGLERYEVRCLMDRLAEYRGRGENPTELAAILRILPNLGKVGVAAIPAVVDLVVEISINGGDEHIYKAAGEVVAYYAQRPETIEQPELRDLLNGEHPSLVNRADTADLVLSRVVKCVGPAMYPIALRRMVNEPTHWRDAFADVLSDARSTDLVGLMPTATPEARLVIAEIIEKNLQKHSKGVRGIAPEHVARVMIDYVDDPDLRLLRIARGILETHSTDVLARIWMGDLRASIAYDSRGDFQMPGDPPLPELDREGLQRRALAGLRYMGEEALPQLMATLRDVQGNRSYPEEYVDTLRTLAEEITASAVQRMQEHLKTGSLTADHRAILEVLPETVLRELIRQPESHLAAAAIETLSRDPRGSTVLTELWMDTTLSPDTRGMARETLAKMSVAASLAFARSPGGLGPREDQRRDRLSEDGMKMSEAGPRNFLEALRPGGK